MHEVNENHSDILKYHVSNPQARKIFCLIEFMKPLLPISHQPRQNWAKGGTSQIKVNPAQVHEKIGHPVARLLHEFNEAVDLSSLRVTHVVFEYIAVVFIDLMHFNLWKVWVHFSVSVRHTEDSRLPVGLPPGLHIETRDLKCPTLR